MTILLLHIISARPSKQPLMVRTVVPSSRYILSSAPILFHAASGWRIHCGVDVTELSTNKQHTLFLQEQI
jgi:hypothetical protein